MFMAKIKFKFSLMKKYHYICCSELKTNMFSHLLVLRKYYKIQLFLINNKTNIMLINYFSY